MDSLTPGTLLARRYRLLDRIGVGGMSVIWRASDEMLDRTVAVKVLAADLAADSRFRDLVRAEARAAAALVHPHVTATYDYGETINTDGDITTYVVMELLEGEPLSARLTKGPLPWPEALRTCAEVAEALAAAHRHGIVHRDVTADNVMLTTTGVKVLDFGIATTVGAEDEDPEGLTFGTPAYVAPERLDGRRARPANDTYALGVLLFETLTGHPPYPAETWEELAETPRGDPPPLQIAGLPRPVAELYHRCLAVDPRQRPSAHQVAWTLRRHLPGTGRRAIRHLRTRRAVAAAGTAAALALGVVLGATLLRPDPGSHGDPPPAAGGTGVTGATDTSPPGASAPTPATAGVTSSPGTTAPDITPTGAPPTAVTLATISEIVADGQASDDIREDVALDLMQTVDNLQQAVDSGSTDLAAAADELRGKVTAREQEGTLGTSSATALHLALDELESTADNPPAAGDIQGAPPPAPPPPPPDPEPSPTTGAATTGAATTGAATTGAPTGPASPEPTPGSGEPTAS